MKRNRWGAVKTLFVILAGVLALTACGGGGGSSDGGSSGGATQGAYTGNTEAAVVDGATAEMIALDSFAAGELQSELGFVPTGSLGSMDLAGTLATSLATQDIAQVASVAAATQTLEPVQGDCGGTLTQTVSSDANGNFSGSMNFANYCSTGTTIDGGMNFSGDYDMQANTMSLTLKFDSLTTSLAGESFTSSGSMSMNMSLDMMNPGPQSITMNMVLNDPLNGEGVWLKDYTMTVTPGSGFDQVTLTGRYYDYQLGYVDIFTDDAVLISDVDGLPQNGMLRFTGASPTWATLTFTGSGGYRVDSSDGAVQVGNL